ncbi:hypothetical protein SARC_03215 [Sphaeroforma arctica JP610]|uniref:Uncharacterized protein n=1 Tax=Sphaeroforma arctica JP610 TaxID=667725 RepID=A0A0L0G6F9_9EUKA|nr:hypothetical protein SARC_03215 [Sphaeroforma arctica JP610]KNC84572.1 hypothetical protein SARC_03215 [Sphaeroforma arctica JP610]|eukprot:XP_014158474.1 hypothetical protein SARC_03215 [Sphaeroforma arctica JP610]
MKFTYTLYAAPVFETVAALDDSYKPATDFTKQAIADSVANLNFSDFTDFEDVDRGFVVAPASLRVVEVSGQMASDADTFLDMVHDDKPCPKTVNPSTWRQAQLMTRVRAYKVIDKVYQIRGFDLAVITIIKAPGGLIVFDPLGTKATAHEAFDFYLKEVGPNTDTLEITKDVETHIIAGLTFEFMLTLSAEAPTEMHSWIEDWGLLNTGENAVMSAHNFLTLRGAKARDPMKWTTCIQQKIQRYGDLVQTMIGQHHWPNFGNENVVEHLTMTRDYIKFTHDQSVCLLNLGFGMEEISKTIEMPKSLDSYFNTRGQHYGHLKHNSREWDANPAGFQRLPPVERAQQFVADMGGIEAVIERGQWHHNNGNSRWCAESMNQVVLRGQHYGHLKHNSRERLPPVERAQQFVADMGGIKAVIERGQWHHNNGNYRWCAESMNQAVFSDPSNRQARYLEADCLEQIGYAEESGTQELRHGKKSYPEPDLGESFLFEMPLRMMLQSLEIKIDPEMAEQSNGLSLNLEVKDTNEKFNFIISHAVLISLPVDVLPTTARATVTAEKKKAMINILTTGDTSGVSVSGVSLPLPSLWGVSPLCLMEPGTS